MKLLDFHFFPLPHSSYPFSDVRVRALIIIVYATKVSVTWSSGVSCTFRRIRNNVKRTRNGKRRTTVARSLFVPSRRAYLRAHYARWSYSDGDPTYYGDPNLYLSENPNPVWTNPVRSKKKKKTCGINMRNSESRTCGRATCIKNTRRKKFETGNGLLTDSQL